MQSISNAQIGSILDFDHGEGWITFSWVDANGIDRSLKIDIDGHCSREMPIRSGSGVAITQVRYNRVQLRFTHELAAKLELDEEIEFEGTLPADAYADLLQLADYF